MDRKTYLIVAGASIASLGIGGYAGYTYANHRLRDMYNKMIRSDINSTRDYYQRKYKEGEYATPEDTAKKLLPVDLNSPEAEEILGLQPAVDALAAYSPTQESETGEGVVESDEEAERLQQEYEAKVRNIFTNGTTRDPWDHALEMETRAANPGVPYILTQEEFMNNETEFDQLTFTYYQVDDVLCDDRDTDISDSDRIVGDVNLTKFGHGSGDPSVLYIRNEQRQQEYEILLERSSYVKTVLGFEEAPERQGLRKFRNGRDE